MPRAIIHVDMDAFYAAIEQRDRPDLRGKPVIVGADPRGRGVVSTASYEARRYGIHSAMPISEAYRRCPYGVYLPVDGAKYARVSAGIMGILEEFSPLVEPLSLDEAFVDITGTERLLGSPIEVGGRIKQRILAETGLTASAGLAPNKFLAKIASDLQKPDGLVVVEPGHEAEFLAPLPIRAMWGVGTVSEADFKGMGIETVGQLARTPKDLLTKRFGALGSHLWVLAHGIDNREVIPQREAKSIGAEQTFSVDQRDLALLEATLLAQAERVARECREARVRGWTVTMKLRFWDFRTLTRSQTLRCSTDQAGEIYEEARRLLGETHGGREIRLIGISVSNLVPATDPLQLDLFAPRDRKERVAEAMDRLRDKFGPEAIARATLIEDRGRRGVRR